MNKKFFISPTGYLIYAICLLLTTGCSEDVSSEQPESAPIILFTTKGMPTTRATPPIVPSDYEQFSEGAVLGVFAYNANNGIENLGQPDLLYNGTLTKTTIEDITSYQSNPAVHWPTATGKVYFAAYYPHNSSIADGAILLSSSVWSGRPEFTVELGIEHGKMDFAVAEVGPITPAYDATNEGDSIQRESNYVNFLFYRKLSEISFRAKTTNTTPLTKLYINSISIRNIYKKGTYKMEEKAWTLPKGEEVDGISGATLKLGNNGSPVSEGDFKYVMNPNAASARDASVVMIPQKYSNVELDVTYTIEYLKAAGGCEYRIIGTKKVPLTVDWHPGRLYVYDIEFGFFEAENEKTNFLFHVKPWNNKDISTEIN